jgi:two-component system, chemotaxis family, response regulator WspF
MKIAIVNDVRLAVEAMRRIIKTVPNYEIAWVAYSGEEAVLKCAEDRPDVILMDLLMPGIDGVETTRQIMASFPCAILIVTATVSGNISKVFEAMGCGALDTVCTPVLGTDDKSDGSAPLLAKIANVAKLIGKTNRPSSNTGVGTAIRSAVAPLMAIGASTGGPQALSEILRAIPAETFRKAATVIVQHVDVQFASGLADWLNDHSPVRVTLAADGQRPEAGTIVLAATNDHLIINPNLTLGYTAHPKEYAYRPSVDEFFLSAARYWPRRLVAVLLTGMGKDGAKGLLALRKAGWHTIAQDQASCVVYGMPKAAAELKAATDILPLHQIAPRLVQIVQRPARESASRSGVRSAIK